MAEIVGVVASGIAVAQLAGAIVGSTRKIYNFWSDIKDAPKHVSAMLVEVELMREILVELFDQNDPNRVGILGQSFAWQKTLSTVRA